MIFSLQNFNFRISAYKLLTGLTITVFLFFFTGCSSHRTANYPVSNAAPKVFSGSFQHTVQQGLTNTIKITASASPSHWNENTQFALIPAGPYVSHRQPLIFQPLAIASDGHYAFVATSSGKKNYSNLLIIQFKPNGQSNILSEKKLINGVITKLAYKNKHLILALKHGGIKILDVSNPTSPVITLSYPTKDPVIDIQHSEQSIYLLLKNNFLLKINLATDDKNILAGKTQHKWKLPVPANSIAVRNNFVFLTGPKGIATLELTSTIARLTDSQKTSGTPKNIQLSDNLALVADGSGGLVVFHINPDGHLLWLGSYNKRGAINTFSTALPPKGSVNKKVALALLSNGSMLSIDYSNPELPGSGVTFKPQQPILSAALLNNRNNYTDPAQKGLPDKTAPQYVALIATEHSLLRVIMTGNNNQLISTEGVNQGGSRRGVIRDNTLYVADWFSGLHLYDISNPKKIQHLSNYHTPGSSKGVVLLDHYAIIGDDDQGLQIVDIKNPKNPRWVSELAPESLSGVGLAYTMKLVKNILYLADHRGGFHIIDLSNIKRPKRLGGYNTPGKSWGIDVVNNFVFVADDTSGLLVFDASNTSKPELVGEFNPGGQAEDVLIKNNLAYVTFFDRGLYILDISQPQKLKVIGHVSIPGNARGLALADNLAYIAGWESGLHIVDISKPETPRILSSYDTDGAAWGVNIKNGVAYVLDWWGGLKAIDVQEPSKPVYLSQYHASSELQQLRSKNKYLFAASGSGGLQVFDIKNPLNPIWSTGVDFSGKALDVWLDEDRAYVAAGKNGVVILDTLDPFYTRRIGKINTPGRALRVRAWNETLYIQDSLAGLMVIDVRDPEHPQELGRYPIKINDLWVDEHALWVSTTRGLVWWDHGDSDALVNNLTDMLRNKNSQAIHGGSHWIRTQNDLVVTAHNNGVIKLWRNTPRGFVFMSKYPTGELVSDLQLDEQTIYVLGNRSGLMAISMSDPKAPRLTAVYPATGKHTRFEIAQGAAFFAGESRLASVTLLPTAALTSTFLPLTSTSHTNVINEFEIHLPTDLPIGQYHLLATTPGSQRELLPNALNVQFSAPNQGKSSLKAMRQMLKTPLKPPTEP